MGTGEGVESPPLLGDREIMIMMAASSTALEENGGKGSDDAMMQIPWFHPNLTRHAADCMLIDNAPEGTYLLRPSSESPYAVSIKLSSSVQHVKVALTPNGRYKFGNSTFDSIAAMRRHFEYERPVIGGDSGVTVTLTRPYMRFVDETHMYTDVVHHAVTTMHAAETDSEPEEVSSDRGSNADCTWNVTARTVAIASKEGYLTKLGRIRKSWRVRWFVLRNQFLSYYKTKQSRRPIDILDLTRALNVEYDDTKCQESGFRIQFPNRTYFFYANSNEDRANWVELLQSKLFPRPS